MLSLCLGDEADEQDEGAGDAEDDDGRPHDSLMTLSGRVRDWTSDGR